jgi:hypothetical protein
MALDHSSGVAPSSTPIDWREALRADLRQVGLRRPWGRALMAVGWVHLVFFLACQAVYFWGQKSERLTLLLWALELAAVLVAMRRVAGRDWIRESPGVGLVVRIWVTYLILSFNVASLNHLTGYSIDWFKPAWCTLGSFGFATLAWLFGYRFLIWAVQMYLTGLLMVQFRDWNYAINGLSWLVILHGIGLSLERQRAAWLYADVAQSRTRHAEGAPAAVGNSDLPALRLKPESRAVAGYQAGEA